MQLLLAAILLVSPLCFYSFSFAEDLLVKKGAKYLGWTTPVKNQFLTCNNTPMEIGDGKIQKTNESCSEPGKIRPIAVFGTVKFVDKTQNFLAIEIKDQEWKVPVGTVPSKESILGIKTGDKVKVTYVEKEGKMVAKSVSPSN